MTSASPSPASSPSPPAAPISFRKKKWMLPAADQLPDLRCITWLATELHLPPLIATLLASRGLVDCPTATAFLDPQFKTIHDPSLLPNIATAVARIAQAIKTGERIVLFGDYDVDGITGTSMLWHTLKAAGVPDDRLRIYIPHRVEEGYGLSTAAIDQLITEGAQLIITVDCGVASLEPIKLARSRNVDVIVTDHHEFGPELPPAIAIVHPRVPSVDSPGAPSYPNPDLCGAGVAYKLCWALATHLCGSQRVSETYRNLLIEFIALVALATIADVVPLIGENRTLVKYGLQQIPRSSFHGLQALMAAAGYGNGGRKVDCTAVGFSLAPRLNAAGRMEHADLAVELLTSADEARAKEIATYLEAQNRDRQSTERSMVEDAKKQIATWSELPHVIVVHSEEHHAGVVGIVASRLVDTFNRPTFVLACDDQECHGSARSIPSFELHLAIEHCRHLLTSGGGHAMAGGVKLPRANLEAFRECLNAYARQRLTPEHFIPTLTVDAILTLADATVPLVTCLQQFEPFGRGNPAPRFLIERAKLTAPPRIVGSTGAHLQLQFSQKNVSARGIAFKMGPLAASGALHVGMELDLVVEPKLDTWNGNQRVDLIIIDVARSDGLPFPAADASTIE